MRPSYTPARPYRRSAFRVVVIAASLGGIHALSEVLSALPPDFPACVIVVQHLSPRYPSGLVELLSRRATLPVAWAQAEQRANRGSIYLAPPDYHVSIQPNGCFTLTREPKVQFTRPSADVLFASAARRYGKRAIAVVLTGKGRDGAQGARAIKMSGGRVLAQDPLTATAFDMPYAAVATGCADFVLPLHMIARALVALVMVPGAAAYLRVPPSQTAAPPRRTIARYPSP